MTLGQLAAASGVSQSYVEKIERGEAGAPSPRITTLLARGLACEVDDLTDATPAQG